MRRRISAVYGARCHVVQARTRYIRRCAGEIRLVRVARIQVRRTQGERTGVVRAADRPDLVAGKIACLATESIDRTEGQTSKSRGRDLDRIVDALAVVQVIQISWVRCRAAAVVSRVHFRLDKRDEGIVLTAQRERPVTRAR